jgi:hypothetical protein
MHSFKDTTGAEWNLTLTVGSIKRVRDEVKGVNLADDVFTGLLDKLAGDTLLMCDVIWSLIKPQAETLGVNVDQWCGRMGGDALDKAGKALLDELIDFSPPPRRALLKQIMEKAVQMQERSIQEATRVINDGTLDKLMGTTSSASDTPASVA